MNIYNKALENMGNRSIYIPKQYRYYSYKNGKAKSFSTQKEALAFSTMIEKVCINKDEHDKSLEELKNYNEKVYDELIRLLKEKYPTPYFDIIFSKAYAMCDTLSDIEDHFEDMLEFADKILSIH